METLELPFNKFVGLKKSSDSNLLLELPDSKKYLDDSGNVHISALFALAEASSSKYLSYLLSSIKDKDFNLSQNIQNIKIKYRKPVVGKIRSKARILGKGFQEFCEELKRKERVVLEVEVTLVTTEKEVVMIAKFEWLIKIIKDNE